MDEYQVLAVAAVEALQLATQPKWTEIVAASVGVAQCGLIAWGIWVMKGSNENRAAMTEMMIQQTKTLDMQTKALERLLERTT